MRYRRNTSRFPHWTKSCIGAIAASEGLILFITGLAILFGIHRDLATNALAIFTVSNILFWIGAFVFVGA